MRVCAAQFANRLDSCILSAANRMAAPTPESRSLVARAARFLLQHGQQHRNADPTDPFLSPLAIVGTQLFLEGATYTGKLSRALAPGPFVITCPHGKSTIRLERNPTGVWSYLPRDLYTLDPAALYDMILSGVSPALGTELRVAAAPATVHAPQLQVGAQPQNGAGASVTNPAPAPQGPGVTGCSAQQDRSSPMLGAASRGPYQLVIGSDLRGRCAVVASTAPAGGQGKSVQGVVPVAHQQGMPNSGADDGDAADQLGVREVLQVLPGRCERRVRPV